MGNRQARFELSLEAMSKMVEFKSRHVWMPNPDIPLCDLASLNWVSHRVHSWPPTPTLHNINLYNIYIYIYTYIHKHLYTHRDK